MGFWFLFIDRANAVWFVNPNEKIVSQINSTTGFFQALPTIQTALLLLIILFLLRPLFWKQQDQGTEKQRKIILKCVAVLAVASLVVKYLERISL